MKRKTVEQMVLEELADRCALDFFTRAPRYRTRKQLAEDIRGALFAVVESEHRGASGKCACGEEIPWSWANEGDRQFWNEQHRDCLLKLLPTTK